MIFEQQFFSRKSYLTVGYNIFPNYLLTDTIFWRNIFFGNKMCVLIFSKAFSKTFLLQEKSSKNQSKISVSLHVIFLVRFTWKLNLPDMFEKYSNTKFHEIPSTRTDGQTDMTKLIVAFRNLTHLIRSPFLSIFSHTQKVSITQVGNFVETHLLAVALNQAKGKQRNKIFTICFEWRIMETELNREKQVV